MMFLSLLFALSASFLNLDEPDLSGSGHSEQDMPNDNDFNDAFLGDTMSCKGNQGHCAFLQKQLHTSMSLEKKTSTQMMKDLVWFRNGVV